MSSQVSLAGLCPKSLVKALIGKEFSLIRVGCRDAWGECGDRVKSQTKPRLCSKEEAGGHGCWDSAHHCSRGVLHLLPRPSLHSLERLVSCFVCSSLLPTPMLVSYPDVSTVSNNCLPFPQSSLWWCTFLGRIVFLVGHFLHLFRWHRNSVMKSWQISVLLPQILLCGAFKSPLNLKQVFLFSHKQPRKQ